MGFFSWNCEVCNKSLKSIYATTDTREIDSVAIMPDGSLIKGEYDGYGSIGAYDIVDRPQVYHLNCWLQAKLPMEYVKESDDAEDQGYFA